MKDDVGGQIVTATVDARFEKVLNDPYGDPIKFIKNLQEANKSSEALLPDEEAGGHIGRWREKTQQFVDGLRAAASACGTAG